MSVTYPQGFLASGTAAGIKDSGNPDMAVVAVSGPAPGVAAATFTTNLSAAAPVVVSRGNLARSKHRVSAVLLTSGNANAATGATGHAHALASVAALGVELGVPPEQVLVCSTGLIGIPFPIDKVLAKIPEAAKELQGDQAAGVRAAEAIMTTDTFAKVATHEIEGVRFGGIAKGAAMIAPNMATMLAVVTTDAVVSQEALAAALSRAVEMSFNRITIDGCTSTNDTVIAIASAASGINLGDEELAEGIIAICSSLASQIVFDAEGATKLIKVRCWGATSESDALAVARKIAESSLVKCSFFGMDPYWGRVLSEVGSAGVGVAMEEVSVAYGPITVYAKSEELQVDREALAEIMAAREVTLGVSVGAGPFEATVLTADLTPAYIAENMRTS